MLMDRSRLQDGLYRQYISRFGTTVDPTALTNRAWNAARILMRKALEEGGPSVTLDMIQRFAQTARPQYQYWSPLLTCGKEQMTPPPDSNWLFPWAEKLYACYLKGYGQTFSSRWLMHKEWQVLLMCMAGMDSEKPIVNTNHLPVITNETVQSYMNIVDLIKAEEQRRSLEPQKR